eukprot:GEMP01062249.1.p1 GENE.GEMP01062249.1~~GEMP01062249.1.p1  ORF type:complete len:111 (-),score=16.83 GEMP01062249.1:99-431(-)
MRAYLGGEGLALEPSIRAGISTMEGANHACAAHLLPHNLVVGRGNSAESPYFLRASDVAVLLCRRITVQAMSENIKKFYASRIRMLAQVLQYFANVVCGRSDDGIVVDVL